MIPLLSNGKAAPTNATLAPGRARCKTQRQGEIEDAGVTDWGAMILEPDGFSRHSWPDLHHGGKARFRERNLPCENLEM